MEPADLHFLASPKTVGYSPKARLLVTTRDGARKGAADHMEQELSARLGEGQS
jgi:hypothetical protein